MLIPATQVNRGGAGLQTAPAVAASTVAVNNPFTFACLVTVYGGTVSVVTVNGVSMTLLGSTYLVKAGGSIALTYAVAPSWEWFGVG